MNWKTLVSVLALTATLTACGGGGGSAGTPLYGGGSTSSAGSTSTASALSIALSSATVVDTNTDGVTVTVTATNASGGTVSGTTISYTVTGGIYTQPTTTTGSDGTNAITVKLGADKSNRTITIVASDGTHTATGYLTVTGAKISSTANPSVVAPSASGSVIFRLLDASSNPLTSQSIEIQTSAGGAISGSTDSNGEYTYRFSAPSTSGTLTVTASGAGVTTSQDVLIQSTSTSIPDSGTPTQVTLDVNPTVVSVNTAGSTANSSVVRALFKGAANNPLANVRVKFDLNSDPYSVGGTFSAQQVYTDANGYAVTSYIPGSVPSPTNGVTIRACYATTGDPSAIVCSSGNSQTKTLTVTADAVSVSIGSDENVYVDTDLVYYRRFVVQVVDGAGRALAGVTITPTLDLVNYAKGQYVHGTGGWAIPTPTPPAVGFYSCLNEDLDRNNLITGSGASSEDINHNGQLDPRKADASVAFESAYTSGKTDSNGRVQLRVTYNRSSASWIKYSLNVSGSVSGSEGRATWIEWAQFPASAISGTGAPAFVNSPYGIVVADVTLAADRIMPDGYKFTSGTTLHPCQNPD